MKKFITYIAAALALVACDDESDFNVNDKPQLIVNALMTTECNGANTVEVRLSGREKTQPVYNANVIISVNGDEVESASPSEYCAYEYLVTTEFKPGDIVGIKASTADGLYSASSSCIVPDTVSVEDVKITSFTRGRRQYSRYAITIRKHTKGTSYYRLVLHNTYTWPNGYGCVNGKLTFASSWSSTGTGTYTYNRDMALTEGNPKEDVDDVTSWDKKSRPSNYYGIFNSSFFVDDLYTLTIDVDETEYYESNAEGWNRTSRVYVHSISPDEYFYLHALSSLYVYEPGSLLSSEPVTGSNINGGIGILSVAGSASFKVDDSCLHLTDNGFANPNQLRHWQMYHEAYGEPWPCDCYDHEYDKEYDYLNDNL